MYLWESLLGYPSWLGRNLPDGKLISKEELSFLSSHAQFDLYRKTYIIIVISCC